MHCVRTLDNEGERCGGEVRPIASTVVEDGAALVDLPYQMKLEVGYWCSDAQAGRQ